MSKYFFTLCFALTVFCSKSFAQLPPHLNSYTDSLSDYFVFLRINYTANDTGLLRAQVQLEQGGGNIRYDSIYTLPAGSGSATLIIGPLYHCASYSSLLFNMSNAQAYSTVTNLFAFSTLCNNTGIENVQNNDFSILVEHHSVSIHSAGELSGCVAEVYDLTGRKIAATNLNQAEQQMPLLVNAGMYLLRITSNRQSLYTTKFVLN